MKKSTKLEFLLNDEQRVMQELLRERFPDGELIYLLRQYRKDYGFTLGQAIEYTFSLEI